MTVPRACLGAGTRLLGVLGDPIAHSLSPCMHNAALAALGLDYCYLAFRVGREQLPAALDALAVLGAAGVNLTLPLKEAALGLVDRVVPPAGRCGAINTVVFGERERIGYNTDAEALLESVRDELGMELGTGARVLVLGAGGAARTAMASMGEQGVQVAVSARRLAAAARLAETVRAVLAPVPGAGSVEVVSWEAGAIAQAGPWDALVNATPVGLPGLDGELPVDAEVLARVRGILDTTYGGDAASSLIVQARQGGVPAVDGRGMLLRQGARAFALFTGQPAPREVMAQALGLGAA